MSLRKHLLQRLKLAGFQDVRQSTLAFTPGRLRTLDELESSSRTATELLDSLEAVSETTQPQVRFVPSTSTTTSSSRHCTESATPPLPKHALRPKLNYTQTTGFFAELFRHRLKGSSRCCRSSSSQGRRGSPSPIFFSSGGNYFRGQCRRLRAWPRCWATRGSKSSSTFFNAAGLAGTPAR